VKKLNFGIMVFVVSLVLAASVVYADGYVLVDDEWPVQMRITLDNAPQALHHPDAYRWQWHFSIPTGTAVTVELLSTEFVSNFSASIDGESLMQFRWGSWENGGSKVSHTFSTPGTFTLSTGFFAQGEGNGTTIMFTVEGEGQAIEAAPSAHSVQIDGAPVNFGAFNIGGNNFFMLRDIAYALNGTPSQFEVTWDGALNAINLITGQAYTPVGGEMDAGGNAATQAVPTTAAVYINGIRANLAAYNIGGNNFFMLRDLAAILPFTVDWDAEAATVLINTH
jgi:hypothetical protein